MDKERALNLARKLAAFNAETATQAEVELAAARLAKIMSEHHFSELDLKEEEAKGRVGEERQHHEWKRPPFWLKYFVAETAAIFRCRSVWHMQTSHITFVGEDTDVGLCKYFVGSILNLPLYNMMYRCWNRDRKLGIPTKGYIPNWYLGFMTAIVKRLKDEYEQWYKELDLENQSKARGLIVIKGNAVRDYMRERFSNLRPMGMHQPKEHSAARARGYEEGLKAKINKGLAAGAQESKKLG